jgi:hypothetical protein
LSRKTIGQAAQWRRRDFYDVKTWNHLRNVGNCGKYVRPKCGTHSVD